MASNNSTNLTTSDLLGRSKVQIGFEVFFAAFICLLSILGNFLVVFVIHKDSQLKNITNVFIHNLAWTDICMAALVMPFWIVTLYTGRWNFSTELCEWTATTQFICANASVWTMGVIAVNRYLKVVKPKIYPKIFPSLGIARVYSVSVWLLAVLFSTPPLYGWGQYAYHQRAALCTLVWKMENISYAIVFVGILFCSISGVIVFCYYKIYRKVRASSNSLSTYAAQNASTVSLNTLSRSTDIKLLKATFTVVCVYAACWAPGALVILSETIFGAPPGFVNTVVVFLVFCSSGANPVIYGVVNPQFKRAFANVLRCTKSEVENQTNQTAAAATRQPAVVVEGPQGGISLSVLS